MARPKAPPLWIVDTAKQFSRKLTRFQRKLAPPSATLIELVSARWRPHAIFVLAQLEIADVLGDGPKDVGAIAKAVGADEGALYRVLRALAHDGLLTRPSPRTFGLTKVTDTLRSDHPRSVRQFVRMLMADYNSQSWARLTEAVKTGEPQFQELHQGRSLWQWIADEAPEAGELFHDSMKELTRLALPLFLATYDFCQYNKILDIGGGQGTLIAGILAHATEATGGVLDLPQALEKAPEVLRATGVEARCELIAGNAFEAVPAGWDAYVLKNILHGLPDAPLSALLNNLRRQLTADAHLLVIEALVPSGPKGTHPSHLDLQMLIGAGGRERTVTEYRQLFADHGFTLKQVVRNAGIFALMVVVPVDS